MLVLFTQNLVIGILFSICIGLIFFSVLMIVQFRSEQSKNLVLQGNLDPFKRKKYFLSNAEKKLFSILINSEVYLKYYIFPQLHLSTLLEVKDNIADMQGKFEWINKLYVDFVIFDKENLIPLLVIELNDSSHFLNNRQSRDEFVAKALKDNQIPLHSITINELANEKALLEKITSALPY